MSVQSEIARIADAKADIIDAIEEKGVEVPDGTKIEALAAKVQAISGGSAKNLSDATVTLAPSAFVYNGKEKTQGVTSVTLDGVALTENQDYVVIGNKATDAGTHSLSVVGLAPNYTGVVTANWSIAKATLAKPAISSGTFTYAPSTTRTPTTDSNFDSATMTKGGDTSAVNAGDYTLSVSLRDTDNYEWADHTTAAVELPWTISKAQGSISVAPTSVSIQGLDNTDTATITKTGDGSVTVKSSNNNIARATISGSTVTVTATGAGTATITVTLAEGDNYLGASCTIGVEVITARVFGVCWTYSATGTALTRLTPSSDPNGYVTTEITTEPVPAVGTGSGSSPFDSYAPWKDMDEYNIVNNAVSYRKGASGFSRSNYDTVVLLPKFYFKVMDNSSGSKRYWYISDNPISDFTLHPGSGCYVGRYHTANSSGYVSKTGLAAVTNITRATARTNSHSKGTNWYQWGIAQWAAIQMLYLVEFADFNIQSKIGNGRAYSNGTAQNSGGTDSMVYHTGRASGTDNQCAVQYRHIENLWGNYYNWLDGVNFNGRVAYVCTDPSKFADDTSSNYTATGITLPSSDGYITKLGYSSACPWVMLPSATGGSETTYIPDYVWSSSGWRVALVAGTYSPSYPGRFGPWYLSASNDSSGTGSSVGSRLLYVS